MSRFRRPELLLAFAAGIIFFALWETLLSYQAVNCSYQQEYKTKSPSLDSHARLSNKSDDGSAKQGHKSLNEPFVCGVAGLPTAIRQFMNHNEGFFVGGFTFMLVFVTGWLVWATLKLWEAGENQFVLLSRTAAEQSRDMQASIKVAQDSAKAAKRSAEVAEAALIAADRAWISITPEIIGPLIFGEESIKIDIGLNIENVGKSPATNVQFWAELCFDVVEAGHRGKKAAQVYGLSILDFGRILFPGDPWERNWLEMEMPSADFRKHRAEAMAAAAEDESSDWDGSLANPAVIACVTYCLAGGKKSHQTVMLFEVVSTEKGHLGWDGSEGSTGLVYLKRVQTFMSGQVT